MRVGVRPVPPAERAPGVVGVIPGDHEAVGVNAAQPRCGEVGNAEEHVPVLRHDGGEHVSVALQEIRAGGDHHRASVSDIVAVARDGGPSGADRRLYPRRLARVRVGAVVQLVESHLVRLGYAPHDVAGHRLDAEVPGGLGALVAGDYRHVGPVHDQGHDHAEPPDATLQRRARLVVYHPRVVGSGPEAGHRHGLRRHPGAPSDSHTWSLRPRRTGGIPQSASQPRP